MVATAQHAAAPVSRPAAVNLVPREVTRRDSKDEIMSSTQWGNALPYLNWCAFEALRQRRLGVDAVIDLNSSGRCCVYCRGPLEAAS